MKVGTDDLTMITLNYCASIATMKDTKDLDVVEAIIRGFSVVDDKKVSRKRLKRLVGAFKGVRDPRGGINSIKDSWG